MPKERGLGSGRRARDLVEDGGELVEVYRAVPVEVAQPHDVGDDSLADGPSHRPEQVPHLVLVELPGPVGVDGVELLLEVGRAEVDGALALKDVEYLLPLHAKVELGVCVEGRLLEELVEGDGGVDGGKDFEDGRSFVDDNAGMK